jgi:hypothetical protein
MVPPLTVTTTLITSDFSAAVETLTLTSPSSAVCGLLLQAVSATAATARVMHANRFMEFSP